jgi:serine protease inhibitor
MRAHFLLLAAFLFVLICGQGIDRQSRAATNQNDADPNLKAIVNANNRFAFDLYGRLRAEKGNLFFSPNSISTALAMTYGGAKADTEKQMADVLHFDLPPDQLSQASS